MILHIIRHSPYQNRTIQHCLAIANSDDKILLIEDGVLNILNHKSLAKHKNILAISADLKVRGLIDKASPIVKLISYEEFVNLTMESQQIVNW